MQTRRQNNYTPEVNKDRIRLRTLFAILSGPFLFVGAEGEDHSMNKRFIIVLIAFMNMIVPLSLDMYLPAVPHMTAAFNTTESTVNLTLVGFFFFMAIGTLIFGPLSDKYGRRGLLVAGTLVYTIFSAACCRWRFCSASCRSPSSRAFCAQ